MRRYQASKIIAAAIGLATAAVLLFFQLQAQDSIRLEADTPLAKINEDELTLAELKHFIQVHRASVIDYFIREHGADVHAGFWHQQFQGEVPGERLLAAAIEEAVRMKVELQLARQHGVVSEISYRALLQEMEKENERREAAIARGEAVYGPSRFDESSFIDFYKSKTAALLKETIADSQLLPSEQQLKLYYESVKTELYPVEDRILFEKFSITYKQNGEHSERMKEQMLRAAEALTQRLVAGDSAEASIKALEADFASTAAVFEGTLVLDESNASQMYKSQQQLYAALRNSDVLAPAPLIIDNTAEGRYEVVKIVERETAEAPNFAEVKDIVAMKYIEVAYEQYVDSHVQAANIRWLIDLDYEQLVDA